jgi:hypothetical protein
MKTPMQELLDKINNEEFDHLDDCKMFIQEYMLEKEKKDRKAVFSIAYRMMPKEYDSAHIDSEFNEFNEIFKTK